MKIYDANQIRNVVLLGHPASGKTTLAEDMLFEAGAIKRRGSIQEHNTVSDYHEIEQERENSVYSTLMHVEWKESKINLLDTPGFDDFIGEALAALKVADIALMVINAQHGPEVQTDTLWEYARESGKPVVFVINQVDHEQANFENAAEKLKNRYGSKVTLLQYPLNPGQSFNSIVDVLKTTWYEFPKGGGKPDKKEIPEAEKERVTALRTAMVENAAEVDESLMEKYFEKGSLTEDELTAGFKKALVAREIFPVFCVSAKLNMGSGRLMGFLSAMAPTAADMPPLDLYDGKTISCQRQGQSCVFVYKTISEPNLGEMSFFKVFSGELKCGIDLTNAANSGTERFNQLFVINGKTRNNTDAILAGDIGATVKLRNTHANQTLFGKGDKLELPPVIFPEPTLRTAVVALTKGEEEKLSMALHNIRDTEPTLRYEYSPELKQTIIHAQGDQHLNLIKWRLEKVYKLSVGYEKPRVPFRETVTRAARSSYRHKKQSGGAGQFAEVHLLVEPYRENMPDPEDLSVRGRDIIDLKWGGKLAFFNCIVGGAIDARFMISILKGVMEKLGEGVLTDSCIRDVRVSVYDGKMHPVDSNDIAFKIAGLMAFKEAFSQAAPIILEPIYEVEVRVPNDMSGDVISDLQTRRAIILGMEAHDSMQVIRAKVPLAEIHGYSSALRAITQGAAKHKQKFTEYAPMPYELQQQILQKKQKELQEA